MRRAVCLALSITAVALLATTCGRKSAVSPVRPEVVARPGATPGAVLAPVSLAPADGAQVTIPVTLAWQAVSDPNGIIAYNWEVSSSATFSPVLIMDSTIGLQDSVSGLPSGSYFWRVQAVSGAFEQGAWSAARSFTVTGTAPGVLAPPVLGPTQGTSTLHPREVVRFHWSPVPGAVSYRLEVSNDARFPVGTTPPGVITFWNDNIPGTEDAFMLGDNLGTFNARVFAVDADNPQFGIRSQPSNVIQYTVAYNNPVGPAPVPVSPTGGATLTLPFSLVWRHVPNPQPSGYEVQISPNTSFSPNEAPLGVQLTDSLFRVFTLPSGSKFWRVRSSQGMASPTTVAVTAWSAPQAFTLSTAPPTVVSVTPLKDPLYSGENTSVVVQLTAEPPAGGSTVTLSSSNPAVAPVPATLAIAAGVGLESFQLTLGQVVGPTPVTITATLNGVSTGGTFTVLPPSLKRVTLPATASSGVVSGGIVELNGQAPPGGAIVSLSSSHPAASPPATLTVPAGSFSTGFSMPTSNVSANTPVTITATWKGVSVQGQVTLTPQQPPATFTLTPTTVIGQSESSFGRVTVANPPANDLLLAVSSSNPAVVSVNSGMIIPAGSIQGGFNVFTNAVSTPTIVNISVTGAGVTLTVALTVNPVGTPPPPPTGLSTLAINPTSVVAGGSATGTVTLVSAAPTGGTTVNLSSGLPLRIMVPATVTVAAGATTATFTVTTTAGPATSTNVSAELAGVIRTVGFLVNAQPPPSTPSAPSLVSPSDGATVAQPVTLDWNDVAGATSYEIQVDNSSTIAAPFTANPTTTASQVTLTGLPAQRLWWRVRAMNSAGVFGPFSANRRFTPGAAPTAASLSAVSVSPTSVVGGSAAQGTVTLTSGAPSGGAVVTLTSATSAVAAGPPSVTIPAGATSATFNVSTTSVTTNNSVILTAAYLGVSRTATLAVTPVPPPPPPASLNAVSVSPSSVLGGTSVAGTVSLTSAAPTGGLIANLTSSAPGVASVPASVAIAAGASSAGFTVGTVSVATATTVTVTATLAGVTRTASLTVNPPATGPLPAPTLVGPSADARFSPGQSILFDWSDVAGAADYTLQVDDDSSFPSPWVLNPTVTVSQFSSSTLPTRTLWWRARANSASGTAGTWSAARRFEVK